MEQLDVIEMVQFKNVSYLKARDPSIITGHFNLENVRVNLREKAFDETSSSTVPEKDKENLQVYLRIKKTAERNQLYEVINNTLLCTPPEGSHTSRNTRDGDVLTKKFSFSKIFGPDTSQTVLFNSIVKSRVLNFINGQNCTLLTYGASGSGKTFTIVGSDCEPGIVPRALEYLFRSLPQLSQFPTIKPEPNGLVQRIKDCRKEAEVRRNILRASSTVFEKNHSARCYRAMQERLSSEPTAIINDVSDVSLSVWVSFAEIYNEYIYDLLLPDPPRGKQRPKLQLGKCNNNTYIKKLTYVNVQSGMEAFQILQYGLHNLKYAATDINSHSSRSHSIFSIKLAQASTREDGFNVSCLNFCDLAGSERLKKTNNVGDRLKESNNINTSLMVLGRCISTVREAQKCNDQRIIPFRESKLTQLFQNALMGYEDISLIVNINPVIDMFDESQHVLSFSAIAKDITIRQGKTMISKKNRFSKYLENHCDEALPTVEENESELQILQEQVYQLTEELEYEKAESVRNEMQARCEVQTQYKEIIAMKDAFYENRIESLRRHYENLLQKQSEQREQEEVICLDSSSEEEADKNNSILEQQIIDWQNEKMEFQNKILMLNEKISVLEKEKVKLQKIIDDAVVLHNSIKNENMKLNIQVVELNDQINNCYTIIAEKTKLIQELENINEKIIERYEDTEKNGQTKDAYNVAEEHKILSSKTDNACNVIAINYAVEAATKALENNLNGLENTERLEKAYNTCNIIAINHTKVINNNLSHKTFADDNKENLNVEDNKISENNVSTVLKDYNR